MAIATYTYKRIVIALAAYSDSLLNAEGTNGWELTAVTIDATNFYAFFKKKQVALFDSNQKTSA